LKIYSDIFDYGSYCFNPELGRKCKKVPLMLNEIQFSITFTLTVLFLVLEQDTAQRLNLQEIEKLACRASLGQFGISESFELAK